MPLFLFGCLVHKQGVYEFHAAWEVILLPDSQRIKGFSMMNYICLLWLAHIVICF